MGDLQMSSRLQLPTNLYRPCLYVYYIDLTHILISIAIDSCGIHVFQIKLDIKAV